jgi:hypothetical protein
MFLISAKSCVEESKIFNLGVIESKKQLDIFVKFLYDIFKNLPQEFTILDKTFYLEFYDEEYYYQCDDNFEVSSVEDFIITNIVSSKNCTKFLNIS